MPIGGPIDFTQLEAESRLFTLVSGRMSTAMAQTQLVDWIRRYRAVKDFGGVYEFQKELLAELQRREDEKRRLEREWGAQGVRARGADLTLMREHPGLADFESHRRTTRALRQIGDALAWRFVQHDRQFMIAMVKGKRTGAIPTGSGLAQELADFEEHWQADRPALLHALTTCMRWGDMTVIDNAGGLYVHESTAGDRGTNRKRRQRGTSAAREQYLRTGADRWRDEPRTHLRLDIPFEHELDAMLRAASGALETGAACEPLGDWGAVLAMSLETLSSLPSAEADERAKAAGDRRRELCGADNRCVIGWSYERQQIEHRAVPYAAFPFPPEIVARILTGRLILLTTLNLDRVVEQFRFVSRRTEVCLPAADDGAWFRVHHEDGLIASFRDFECVRLLYEAMHPRTLVAAHLRMLRVLPPKGVRLHTTFGLKDEAAVWL